MKNGSRSLFQLLMGAVLTLCGLAAIAIGVAMMIAPPQACGVPAPCISAPTAPAVADRARHSATD